MYHNRRQLLKGLLGAPFVAKSILHASTKEEHGYSSRSHSHPASSPLGTACVHFEGVFGFLVYSDHIEAFTPSLSNEHEYCFGLRGQRFYGYPPMDLDLQQVLPNTNGKFQLNDKTKHIIVDKTAAGITNPDFTNRYWRIKVPIPSDITAEGVSSQVKQPFKGKNSSLVNQITQIQTSYKFSYDLDQAAMRKLHLSSTTASSGCLLELKYCVVPKVDDFAHAVRAFHGLRVMLPDLDLDLKDDIGHSALTKDEIRSLDAYVKDGDVFLCLAPSVFVTGL